MWILLVGLLWLTVSSAEKLSEDDIHEMELSTFYADCAVYDDPALFGGPVCGSDGQTYANCVHLSCLNHWRLPKEKVKLVSKGPCECCELPPGCNPVYAPVCGSDDRTYANVGALKLYNKKAGKDITVKYKGECLNKDFGCLGIDSTFWDAAVCATNGRTYPSVAAIADMRKFGQCLDVLHDGGCTVQEVKKRIRTRAEVCDLARNFYEFNPVCGADNVTYANPYILLCFKPNVKTQYMGECDSQLHLACQAAVDIDLGALDCPGPVCGSDGLTYTSTYHLECARNNDKYLEERHKGACQPKDNPCANLPEVMDAGTPVCGSDGVTYVNSVALWCIQRKQDPFLRFFHDGPCFRRCVECSCGLGCAPQPQG